eukprot:TRINITY_DN8171_c1_g1_i1.p5 TRINITY_DN8171_c1_g1~~TRINITY_DN8171_c1_g1_i1.p5  ORF type:complete len:100 (+),score=2.87 TRINITY_DN8171_c1_g1_i1:426-725(+)
MMYNNNNSNNNNSLSQLLLGQGVTQLVILQQVAPIVCGAKSSFKYSLYFSNKQYYIAFIVLRVCQDKLMVCNTKGFKCNVIQSQQSSTGLINPFFFLLN